MAVGGLATSWWEGLWTGGTLPTLCPHEWSTGGSKRKGRKGKRRGGQQQSCALHSLGAPMLRPALFGLTRPAVPRSVKGDIKPMAADNSRKKIHRPFYKVKVTDMVEFIQSHSIQIVNWRGKTRVRYNIK